MKETQQGLWKLAKMIRHGPCDDDGFGNAIETEGGIQKILQRLASSCSSSDTDCKTGCVEQLTNVLADDDWSFEITEEEVFHHLRKMNIKKSSGERKIPTRIYVTLGDCIARPRTRVLRSCINKRQLPDPWKQGIVVPVPKSKPVDLNKIRYITLLSPLSKILEKLILKKARNFFIRVTVMRNMDLRNRHQRQLR